VVATRERLALENEGTDMAREEFAPGPGPGTPGHYFQGPASQNPAFQNPPSQHPAVQARRPEPATSAPVSSATAGSIDDQIRDLAWRRDQGLISYQQFAALKAEIFARS